LETLVDTTQYDSQILTLETAYGRNEEELRRKELAKERLYSLLEEDKFNRDEFYQRLAQNDNEILRLKSLLADTQAKIETLREAQANNEAFNEFVKGNQEWLSSIRQELNNLSPMDKKRLAESLVDGKISVWIGRLEDGEKGPEWAVGNLKFSFNRAIFDSLAAEGKLSNLTKNGHDPLPSPQAPFPTPG